MYSIPEQSRRPCVKCRRDGELPDGRRNAIPRWGHRTRCPYRISSFMRGDTRSGEWSAVIVARSLPLDHRLFSPRRLCLLPGDPKKNPRHKVSGSFIGSPARETAANTASQSPDRVSPLIKEDFLYGQRVRKHHRGHTSFVLRATPRPGGT